MSRIFPHPNPVAQEILDLLAERPNLSEKDLKFAITHILNGNSHNGNGRITGADHLQQEIFDKQSPELQEFMLQTALLPQSEKLPRFCNALLAIDDAEVHLQAMADNNLLGDSAFTEFLRDKLKQNQAAYRKLCLKTAKILDSQIRSQKAIGLFVQAEAWDKAAELLENYGQDLYDRGRALDLYEWLGQLDEKKLEQRPRLLLLKARILNDDLRKPKQALMIFNRAEQAFKQQGYLMGIIEAQIWQSNSLRMMGQGAKSLELAVKAVLRLSDFLVVPKHLMARALKFRGLAYSTVGQVSEALADLQQSLELSKSAGDTHHTGTCHHDIGICLRKQGKLIKAEHHYKKAINIWRTLDNQNDLVNTLNSLGVLLCVLGRYERALEQVNTGFQIATKIGAVRRQSFILQTMGDVYLGRQEYKQAIEFYTQSTEFAEKAGVQSLKVANMVMLGECYFYLGDLDLALELSWQAGNLANENGLVTEYGLSIALRARIYMCQGQSCTDLFEIAVKLLAEGDALEQTRVRLWLADNLMQNSRLLAASEQLREVVDFVLTMGDLADRLLQTVDEIRPLLAYFLHHPDTSSRMVYGLDLLLKKAISHQAAEKKRLQMLALGETSLIIEDRQWGFSSHGVVGRTPEFLLYFILESRRRRKFSSEQIYKTLWPDIDYKKARHYFYQILNKLRDVNFAESPDFIKRTGHFYRLKESYWCDVLAFENLFARASVLPPSEAIELWLEIIFLYQGEFLEGFELSEWGEAYRTRLREEFLETARLATEYLLEIDKPEKALEVARKSLIRYTHNEVLRHLETKIQAQLNSQNI